MRTSTIEGGTATLRIDAGRWQAHLPRHVLSSHFQPILSLSHRRIVGFEALLRGRDNLGQAVAPLQLFASQPPSGQIALDELAAYLHLRNFVAQRAADDAAQWLFVNLRPESFLHALTQHTAMSRSLREVGAAGHQLVVEVTEEIAARDLDFEACAVQARALGCLLALDDFGAGHSNFDRVWRLQPEIVKLDRSLVQRGAQDAKAARVIAQMVSLLHECGSLVLMEGIETADEAHLALDCDADLVQGYFFGRPQAALQKDATSAAQLGLVWDHFEQRSGHATQADRHRIAPYAAAIARAGERLAHGDDLAVACTDFLRLVDAQLCYLLDAQGIQLCASLTAIGFGGEGLQRFAPMRDTAQACWARRPYFRRALEAPGVVQLTRPYLSIQGARLCVTVSVALRQGDQLVVVCGDLAWHH